VGYSSLGAVIGPSPSKRQLIYCLLSSIPESPKLLQSKYSARSAHYLGMIFINQERIALLESKFHFQIED